MSLPAQPPNENTLGASLIYSDIRLTHYHITLKQEYATLTTNVG